MAEDTLMEQGDSLLLGKAFLDAFLDPVVLLNDNREVLFANTAAAEVLEGQFLDRNLSMSFRYPDVLQAVTSVIDGGGDREVKLSLSLPIQRNLDIRVIRIAKPHSNKEASILMVFDDVSSESLAEQMRQDFVANVSHELRSPIASLMGFIETLQGPAKEDVEAREKFLTIMADESRRMARMIDDLLSLSRVEASERIRPHDSVDVVDLLNMTRELLIGRATGREMELVIEFEDELPSALGDRDGLMEVFQNLIDNAIKYGRESSKILIRANSVARIPEIGGRGISVEIVNQGDGIAGDQIPRLTERFYRVDKGRSRKMGGTGLGLAIVKHIINRHRGRLGVESELGGSTTFTVFLPV